MIAIKVVKQSGILRINKAHITTDPSDPNKIIADLDILRFGADINCHIIIEHSGGLTFSILTPTYAGQINPSWKYALLASTYITVKLMRGQNEVQAQFAKGKRAYELKESDIILVEDQYAFEILTLN